MAFVGEETRILARLPHAEVAFVHRRPREGGGEQVLVALHLAPSARFATALADPFLSWMLLGPTLWSSWLSASSMGPRQRPGHPGA